MTTRTLIRSARLKEKRMRIHALADRWAQQSIFPVMALFMGIQMVHAVSRATEHGKLLWLWWCSAIALVITASVLVARRQQQIAVLPEGLEFRTGDDVRCFPWRMIWQIEPVRFYPTASYYSKLFRVVLVSGSTFTFIGRRDALERIDVMRGRHVDPWRFEV